MKNHLIPVVRQPQSVDAGDGTPHIYFKYVVFCSRIAYVGSLCCFDRYERLSRNEVDDGGLFVGPEVFPAPEMGVDGFGGELMEPATKLRPVAVWVRCDPVPMVRRKEEGVNVHPISLGGDGQAVQQDVIDFLRGSQQKLSLGAASREHRGGPGDDGSR